MKRVNLAHSEETRRLRDEMATMERDFRERIVYLERQVGEEREVEKFNAQFKDFAQIVEDLKTVKMNTEAQQDLIKQTATQMQNKHEDVLRQFRENCQNSTKELFKLIQEEDQRMCRLREELGLCGDLENRWRTQIKDNLLGDVDEGVLTMGIRCQLEETIRALHATVSYANLA
uniref:GAT domain containing protein n=1 Tax=Echinococcus granulosus TaxID=6210 RepID=A0A068WT63_ECHGR|nr:GAT domain containing protein [Echinococcus granulosus]